MDIEEWFYSLTTRLRSLLHPNQVDQEMKEELREHLEQQIEENIARGMAPKTARYAAMRAWGGIAQIEQQCRDARGGSALEDFVQDLRYGFRQLCRNPGFSALAILCLTLGIGANAAVFSWVEGILFRPYPAVAHQERLFPLAGTARGETGAGGLSWPDFQDLRRNCSLCEEAFVSKITGSTLSVGDHAETARGSIFYMAREYSDAMRQYRKTLDFDANFSVAYWGLGLVYEQLGMYDEAIAQMKRATELSGGSLVHLAALGRAYAVASRTDEALGVLEELKALSKERFVPSADVALIHVALGDGDGAFALLEKAYEEHADLVVEMNVFPGFDPIRSDPRFADLLRRIRLPQ